MVGSRGFGVFSSGVSNAVTSVTGTANRITVTGTTTAVIDIASTYVGQSSITTLGTITTGVWNGDTLSITYGGTGATTAQGAIDALTQVSGATNEYVLTKDTASGNALWKEVSTTNYQQVYYVGKNGNDANSGLNPSKAVLTIAQAITLASAQTPNSTNRFKIEILDAGIYSESLLQLPSNVDLIGLDATIKNAGAHNTIQQAEDTLINVYRIENDGNGSATLVGTNSSGRRFAKIERIIANGSATAIVNFAISSDGEMFINSTQIAISTGKGISDNSLDGHIHVNIGAIDISGNGGVALFQGGANSNVSGHIIHIQEDGSPTSTVGLDINDGTCQLSVNYLNVDAAYDVAASGTLRLYVGFINGTETNAGTLSIMSLTSDSTLDYIVNVKAVKFLGTGGVGYLEMPAQSSNASAPASGIRIYADATGRPSWTRVGGAVAVLDDSLVASSQAWVLPNVSGTFVTTGNLTDITATGTVTSGTWNGSVISEVYGGTNQSTYTTGDILYASASNTLSKLLGVATGNALISGGVSTAPSWGKIGLTTHISGTLPVGNGGTNITSYTAGDIIYASGATTLVALAKGTIFQVLRMNSGATAPEWGEGSSFIKVTKSHTDFTAAATSESISLFTLAAGQKLLGIVIKPTTAFAGTGITAFTLEVGIAGSTDKYASSSDVFVAVSDIVFYNYSNDVMENWGSSTTVNVTARSTGGNLDATTAGDVEIYYLVKTVKY